MSNSDPRLCAIRALASVVAGAHLQGVLAEFDAHMHRGLIYEITFGVLRHWFSLNELLDRTLDQPRRLNNTLTKCALLAGIYQLAHMKTPSYAVVSESVRVVRQLNQRWATGLVNATLRNCSLDHRPSSASAVHEAPKWLIQAVQSEHPDQWSSLLRTLRTRAPLALRVNARRGDVDAYVAKFGSVLSLRTGFDRYSFTLAKPLPRSELPGHAEGWVSIQDETSQRAVSILDPRPHDRVLDACAAPGVKSLQLAERQPDIELVSIDVDASASAWLDQECTRLGVAANVSSGDATTLDWWDGEMFDKILLDAPCSGTGTLRRHPDIKIHRRPADVDRVARLQSALLRNLWRTLKPGGALLYTTCSILERENQCVVEAFLERTSSAESAPLSVAEGCSRTVGQLVLPQEGGGDGFYFCLLTKTRD